MWSWRRRVSERVDAWIARRNPPRPQIGLSQRNIYIMPSRVGIGFLAMLLGMLLLAINYQNNLIFGLCFWLFSLFLVTILHTFANLSGLALRAGSVEPVFAGQQAHFHLHIDAGRRPRRLLQVGFRSQSQTALELEASHTQRELRLPHPADKRGLLSPARVYLRADFPLGLLRCWSLPALDWQCVVYPEPKMLRPLVSSAAGSEGSDLNARMDSDEFSGFQRYRVGEPPRRIYWKAYAKGQGLISKHFDQARADELILSWDSLPDLNTEDRLSTLCAWALECDRRNLFYGLHMPAIEIAVANGHQHLSEVLRTLALYQSPEANNHA